MPANKSRKLKETFQLQAPAATAVMLAGDFTGWESEPIQMKRLRSGVWKATVSLDPGRHEYRFVVDGRWTDDPQAPAFESNPYGSRNSIREVASV
jgi:1,4-alpha-glucan branching enzyme